MKKNRSSQDDSDSCRDVLLEAAIGYAEAGLDVFPVHSIDESDECTCGKPDCGSPGKHPAVPRGHKEATTNAAKIKRWWAKKAWNIGAVPSSAGCLVWDVDPQKEGEADRVAEVTDAHGDIPATFTVLTGEHDGIRGRHYWFRAPEGSSLPRKVAGIDLRSGESYVLMPPSRHYSGVAYEIEEGDLLSIPDAPTWIQAAGQESASSDRRSAEPSKRTGLRLGRRTKMALESNLLPEPAAQESHRDVAVGIARNLYEAGSPPELVEATMARMLENPESSLDPGRPWRRRDAIQIVSSVTSRPAPDSESIAGRSATLARRQILGIDDARRIAEEEIDWIIPGLIARGEKGLIAGAPKSYKTWVMLHLARCVVCAEPVFGNEKWKPRGPQAVLIVEEEGSHQHWGRRVSATFSGRESPPVYYCHRPGISLRTDADVDWIIAEARDRDVGLIFLDPLQRVSDGANENDAGETGPLWDNIHRIATETDAAVVVLHHTNKSGSELGQDAIRGSTRVAGEVDFWLIQRALEDGGIEMRINGRDLDLEGGSDHLFVETKPDAPHEMELLKIRMGPRQRDTSLSGLALEVLESADGWLTTAEVVEAVKPHRKKAPTKQGMQGALDKLEADGRIQKRRHGSRNALQWRCPSVESSS